MAELIKVEGMKALPKFYSTIGILPTSYRITMTYDEQVEELMRFIREEIIPKFNENAAALGELQTKFVELVQYVDDFFNNLDLEEEVSNKLDEMIQDGTMEELISTYILPEVQKKIPQKKQIADLGIEPGTLTEENVDVINEYIAENDFVDLQFGEGIYILPKPIVLLQGRSICGVGNSTKLVAPSGEFAIIVKGSTTINSTTEISNMTIDGNFEGNGIYIDGTRYSRSEIHDIFVVSCLYGIRNAQPSVANVYDDNFGVGVGGNNIHDIYIFGEAPNDDTSRCIDGLVIYAADNFISNVRISGYGNYGANINGSGNQFCDLKCAVNHIGIRIAGGQQIGTICAEESFQNNVELSYVRNSNLHLKVASAGCVVADSLPNVLQYYDVDMQNCSNNILDISGFVAQSFTYRKAGELAMLNLQNSILNKINVYFGNSQVPNEYCLPIISNCANVNDILINNNTYDNFINYDFLDTDDFSIVTPANITITGDYPNLTIENTSSNAQRNYVGFDLTDLIDEKLAISDICFNGYPPQNLQISYKFTEEGSAHNYTSGIQFISNYGQNGSFFSQVKIKDILEGLADYINGIQLGYNLQYVRVYLQCTHSEQGTSKHKLAIIKLD